MTSVTQKIPNFIGGISQQPDELMPEGSLREALNVIPDVTDGLRKRPGSRLVNPLLTTETGSWFHFNYADNEKYIGKINFNGEVNIFSCVDGLPTVVTYAEYEPSDEADGNPSTGYPDCDLDAYNAARIAYTSKKREYEIANAEFNTITGNISNTEQNPNNLVLYEVTPQIYVVRYPEEDYDSYDEWLSDDNYVGRTDYPYNETRFILTKGYIRRSGPDLQSPSSAPDGYSSLRRGNLRKQNTSVYYKDNLYKNVDLYELVAVKDNSSDLDNLNEQQQAKQDEVNALKSELDALEAALEAEAGKCGLSINNTGTRQLIASNTVPTYLKHTREQQIRTQTIGNRVFLINPKMVTGMNSSAWDPRQRENFIEINVAAAVSDYSLELVAADTGVTPYTEVREAVIIDGLETVDDVGDDGGSGQWRGFETKTFSEGDKQNLTLELTINGQQIQAGNGNSISDFKYEYTGDVRVLNPGVGWQVGDVVTMTVAERDYKIKIQETETMYTAEGAPITVPITPNGADQAVKASSILADMAAAIESYDSNFTTKIIGNGIWVIHSDPNYVWRFSCANKALVTVTTQEVNSVVQLPTQCRSGYTVKVANTDSDDDDYWAYFKTEEKGVDGPGVWEETVAPGLNRYFNPDTMPHQISRQSPGTFVVSPIEWAPREVGDNNTNPKPGFITNKGVNKRIENMVLFRSRMCILSGDTITCSRPNDFFNFWSESALTVSEGDPVDISCGASGSSANAVLTEAIEINQGLVCFTGGEQFILGSDSEAFTPQNARFSRVGTYRYSGFTDVTINDIKYVKGVPVFSLGNSVGFLADSGLNTRLLEMFNVGQSADSAVNELTKPISRLIPYGINLLAESNDNNLIVLGNRGTKDVWVYRYFDNDQRRVQSAWFKWTLPAKMAYHCIMDDVYWSVSYSFSDSVINEGKPAIVSLQRIDLKDELATAFVNTVYEDAEVVGLQGTRVDGTNNYQAHLDNYRIAQPSEFTYYNHINQTYFRAPLIYYKDLAEAGRLRAYMLSPTIKQKASPVYGPDNDYYFESIGSMIPIRVEEDNMGTWFVMDGDWSNTRMMIGYVFDMDVEIPTIYPSKSQETQNGTLTVRDTRSYLNLHRLKINLGQIGVLETRLKVKGRDDYTEMYECKTMDDYPANEIAFDQIKTQVIPVYSKNIDTTIRISSDHPSPCTIHSLEWEGDIGTKWYKRV